MCNCVKLNTNLISDLNTTSAIIYARFAEIGNNNANLTKIGYLNKIDLHAFRNISRYVDLYKRLVSNQIELTSNELYLLESNLKHLLNININIVKYFN